MKLPEKKWVSYHKIHKENNNLSFDERALINFDHPRAIDFDLLVAHLKELKAEKQFTNLFIL
jgi:uridine kinase